VRVALKDASTRLAIPHEHGVARAFRRWAFAPARHIAKNPACEQAGFKAAQWRRKLWERLRHVWWGLRQVSGDAAYENYLMWTSGAPGPWSLKVGRVAGRGRGSASPVLSPEEFYLEGLKRKYTRVSRCC